MNESTIETLSAMRTQEANGYTTQDWRQLQQNENLPLHLEIVDSECREVMASWCTQVVDYCKFTRETVEVSMSLLDRFVCTPAGREARLNRDMYRLACMSALYSSIKIHEASAMDPKLVSNLSHGAYSPSDIENMESQILHAVGWRVNPPTSMAFVRELLSLIPEDIMSQHTKATLLDLSKLQSELAVKHFDLVATPASVIAFSALCNSMESLGMDIKISQHIQLALAQALGLNSATTGVSRCQLILLEIVNESPETMPAPVPRTILEKRVSCGSVNTSPRSISH